jgi:alkanesulfonate monooxygenase SsuD/methylene tetrahydromethanopterin reductase-like flavin-dependent oxidoreductase (luciferase family)
MTLRVGALCWNQYTDWPSLLEAGRPGGPARLRHAVDVGPPLPDRRRDGPIFEGWLTLAAWAQATERVRIGLMVGANTFREPALTAKMATTLDHISGGPGDPRHRRRLVRGGARGVRAPFGDGFPERLRWLGEALPVMRGMLHGERPTASGPRYRAKASATTHGRSRSGCRSSSAAAASR